MLLSRKVPAVGDPIVASMADDSIPANGDRFYFVTSDMLVKSKWNTVERMDRASE